MTDRPVPPGPDLLYGQKFDLEGLLYRGVDSFNVLDAYFRTLSTLATSRPGILYASLPGYCAPLFFRGMSTDIFNLRQIFVQKEYSFKFVGTPKRILDLGAYCGYAAVYLANRFPSAEIFCVEPSPENSQLLRMNTAPYENIRTVNAAAWHRTTKLRLVDKVGGDWGSVFAEQDDAEGGIPGLTILQILQLAGWLNADYVKCDVEGAELELFSDPHAPNWIAGVSCISVEVHDRFKPGCTEAVERALPEANFARRRSGEFHVFDRKVPASLGEPRSQDLGPTGPVQAAGIEMSDKPAVSAARRIFDCFIFFNELDLLELRFEELHDKVDFFVLCEANRTFKGEPKPLFFLENKERFAKYLAKVRHIVVEDMPTVVTTAWEREFFQRRALQRGLTDLHQEDVVVVSDCDEILSRQTIDLLRNNEGYFMLDMPMYQFYLNMRAMSSGWRKPFAYSYYMHDRIPDYSRVREAPVEVFERFRESGHHILSAGWHFTFLGGAGRVTEKIRAYSHTEKWQRDMLRPGNAEQQMMSLKDVGGGRYLQFCQVDASFPRVVQERYGQLVEIGFVKDAKTRIDELQSLVARSERSEYRLTARCRYLSAQLDRMLESDHDQIDLACGKPATQSSISRWSQGKTCAEDAGRGNDGMLYGQYGFHTEAEENPWWRVDLLDVYRLREVRIFNRPDQAWRLRHFSILGSLEGEHWILLHKKTDDAVFGHGTMEPYVAQLAEANQVRYVKIQLDGEGYLHFDECMIFGTRK